MMENAVSRNLMQKAEECLLLLHFIFIWKKKGHNKTIFNLKRKENMAKQFGEGWGSLAGESLLSLNEAQYLNPHKGAKYLPLFGDGRSDGAIY